MLIAFEDKIAYIFSNKKQPIVTDLLFRGSKLNNFLYVLLCCTKNIALNFTQNEIPKFQKIESFSKLYLLIHQIATFKSFLILKKILLENNILY